MQTDLAGDADAPSIARGFARSAATGLPEGAAHDLVLLVSELVADGFRERSDQDEPIHLTIRSSGDSIRVTVRGVAHGEEPLEPSAPPSRGVRGLRTVLLEEVASDWGVEPDDPTAVWFELAIRDRRPHV
jgi:hypothetical protein